MSTGGGHIRNRHVQDGGLVKTRDTHGPPGFTPQVTGVSYGDARDGEQSQVGDVAPRVIQTGHFDLRAAAPMVNNNPLAPTTAEVIIDEDGIHIANGKLFLTDYGGTSVLGPAGFDGSWVEFIETGVYNGGFNAGITSWAIPGITGVGPVVQATTIVSSADTPDEYLASLSAAIPYWIISDYVSTDNTMVAGIVADSTNGRYLAVERSTGVGSVNGGTMTFAQDAPVIQGREYEVEVSPFIEHGGTQGSSILYLAIGWRDSEHGQLTASVVKYTWTFSTIAVNLQGLTVVNVGTAPVGAKYARIFLSVVHAVDTTGAGSQLRIHEVRIRPVPVVGALLFPHDILGEVGYSRLQSAPEHGLEILSPSEIGGDFLAARYNDQAYPRFSLTLNGFTLGSGAALPDIHVSRGAANRLDLAAGDGLRIGTTTHWGSGTTFPTTGLTVGDRFYRVDHQREYYYAGPSTWYTTQIYETPMQLRGTLPIAPGGVGRWDLPLHGTSGAIILAWRFVYWHGAALTAINYWYFDVTSASPTTPTTFVSTTKTSGAASTWFHHEQGGLSWSVAAPGRLEMQALPSGVGAGELYCAPVISYRLKG